MGRRHFTCQLCESSVVRLTTHMLAMHQQELGSVYRCKLFANYGRLEGRTIYRGLKYRICPVYDCPAIMAEVSLHLRNVHCYTGHRSRVKATHAIPINSISWEVNEPDTDPDRGTKRKRYSSSSSGSSASVSVIPPSRVPRGRSIIRKEKMPSTSCPSTSSNRLCDLTEEWSSYLKGVRGGSVKPSLAREYAMVVNKYINYWQCQGNPQETFTVERVEAYIEKFTNSPSWKVNIFIFLQKFGRFLVGRGLMEEEKLKKFRDDVGGIRRTLGKIKAKGRAIDQSRRRPKITRVNMEDFYNHPRVVDSLNDLVGGVTDTNYHKKRYIIALMALNSGARTGAVAGATIQEIKDSERMEEGGSVDYVLSVAEHKTFYQGPFQIPLDEKLFHCLVNICSYVEGKFPQSTHPFVTTKQTTAVPIGKEFTTSRISQEFSRAWALTDMLAKYGEFNITDNRKRIATILSEKFPHMREQIAKQLKHSVSVERAYYDLGTGGPSAVNLRNLLKNVDKERHTEQSTLQDDTGQPTLQGDESDDNTILLDEADLAKFSFKTVSISPAIQSSSPPPLTRTLDMNSPMSPLLLSTSESEDDEDVGPVQPIKMWLNDLPDNFSAVQSNVISESQNPPGSDSFFDSITTVMTSKGKTTTRRTWSRIGNLTFKADFGMEIMTCKMEQKKPKVSFLKQKLSKMPEIAARWRDLTTEQLKDKIFTEAQKK